MARSHFTKAVIRRVSGAPADGTVSVFKTGTNTPLDQKVYAAGAGAVELANPFPFTNGLVDFFLDQPERVRLVITPTGSTAQTFDNNDVQRSASDPVIKTVRTPHTFAVPGDILVPAGSDNVIPGFYVSLPAGQTAKLALARFSLGVGTSVGIIMQRNGANVGVVQTVTTTPTVYDITDVVLADGDYLNLLASAPSGSPKNLSWTVFIDSTV